MDEIIRRDRCRRAPISCGSGWGRRPEQRSRPHRARLLTNVGHHQDVGRLVRFSLGRNRRAPDWMQSAGLEWLYRLALEPRRLFYRYLTTNPHALFLLLTGSTQALGGQAPERRLAACHDGSPCRHRRAAWVRWAARLSFAGALCCCLPGSPPSLKAAPVRDGRRARPGLRPTYRPRGWRSSRAAST